MLIQADATAVELIKGMIDADENRAAHLFGDSEELAEQAAQCRMRAEFLIERANNLKYILSTGSTEG